MKTPYQQAKAQLKEFANIAKSQFRNDKPAINQCINDEVYWLGKALALTEYQKNLLSNYAVSLHV